MEEIDREMDPSTLKGTLDLVYKYTGINMNESKKSLLQGRVRSRMKSLQILTFKEYLDYLNSTSNEVQEFINVVTTNETSFFRTKRVWDFFRQEFLPEFSASNSGKPLQIWSGAASTGEELYSIAMCCEEHHHNLPNFYYKILGTDISTEVLNSANKGTYGDRSVAGLKSDYSIFFNKYIITTGNKYIVKKDIASKVIFKQHNLFSPPPAKESFDLVFLRNVLIYFEKKDQIKVIENIYESLVSGGILIIGESESLSSLNTKFTFRAPQIYVKG